MKSIFHLIKIKKKDNIMQLRKNYISIKNVDSKKVNEISKLNLKAFIFNKYNYKVNKRDYNMFNNFRNAIERLRIEHKDNEMIINKMNEFIYALCLNEHKQNKQKGLQN